HAEVFTRFNDRGADLFAFFVGSPDFQTGSAGHTVTQCAYLATFNVDVTHVEEFNFRNGGAVQLAQNIVGIRALNLESILGADHGLASRIARGALIACGLHVVSAGSRMEFNPVRCGRASYILQLVFREVEQNSVTDDVSVVTARCEMFRTVYRELGERIERQVRNHLQSIGP